MKKIHKKENGMIQEALKIAQKSDMRSKHGCVIVDSKNNIIATGYNKMAQLTKEQIVKENFKKYMKASYHAEEMALHKVNVRKLQGARMYVIRKSHDEYIYSKPCVKCMYRIQYYIKHFGLYAVYYTDSKKN